MISDLFLLFMQIGMFTIGGGPAMLPLVQQALIERGWMTLNETIDMVAISQMTPGPFAVNAATFTGMRMAGVTGSLSATMGVMMPSLIIVTVVAHFFFRFQRNKGLQTVLTGVRPVIPALITASVFSMVPVSLGFESGLSLNSLPLVLIALSGAGLVLSNKINPAWVILAGGVLGAVFLH